MIKIPMPVLLSLLNWLLVSDCQFGVSPVNYSDSGINLSFQSQQEVEFVEKKQKERIRMTSLPQPPTVNSDPVEVTRLGIFLNTTRRIQMH